MAVQAQYPSNIPMADFCMRRQVPGKANSFGVYGSMEDLQQFQLLNGSVGSHQLAMMNSLPGGSLPIQQNVLNGVPYSDAQNQHDFICSTVLNTSNKRPRQSIFLPVHHTQQQQQQQQQQHQQQAQQQHQHQPQQQQQQPHRQSILQGPVAGSRQLAANQTPVSTGLRLAFPDDRLSSTGSVAVCGKLDLTSATISLLNDEIALELQRQRQEIEQLIRAQEDQMRRAVEEKQQQQSRSLLQQIERSVARRLREKDMEIEKVNHRNMELEERVKQLTVEARLWQSKAKSGEALVASLRTNLQQAVALSREQSREGVGDTDADDAESCHPDDSADVHARTYKENKELKEKRTCRVCRCNEVSILLLPCRHLCLCKECEPRLDACPLCRHSKNASVQVYMS